MEFVEMTVAASEKDEKWRKQYKKRHARKRVLMVWWHRIKRLLIEHEL